MYRIVKEENRLSGKIQYIIEKRKKFLWMISWTKRFRFRYTTVRTCRGPYIRWFKYKLDQII